MSVAIRTATRVQDQDDVNVTVGAGVDEYALCWDNDTAKFVLRAIPAVVTDHGALTGLSDDDHAGYALLAGRSGGQTLYGGTDANDDITIHGTSNATRTTSYVILQPTGGNVGIGTTSPGTTFDVVGTARFRPGSTLTISALNDYNTKIADSTNLTLASGTSSTIFLYGGISGGAGISLSGNTLRLSSGASPAERARIDSTGNVGIGTTSPATILHALTTDTATNAVTNVVTIGHNTSGTAAAGFGGGLAFNLQSSTTASQSAALVTASWIVATHASRTARLALSAYDYNGAREGIRIDTDGSAALLGFYAHSAVAQQVLATGAGASVDNVISALQALGLVKQS